MGIPTNLSKTKSGTKFLKKWVFKNWDILTKIIKLRGKLVHINTAKKKKKKKMGQSKEKAVQQ